MNSSNYSLWIPPRGDGRDYPVHEAFALHLQKAFAQIGEHVPLARKFSELQGRTLVLSPHRIIEHPTFFVPKRSILINTEHLTYPMQAWQRNYAEVLEQFEVWDFSPRNIGILRQIGIRNAKFLELGGLGENLAQSDRTKDIDVLFYGALNDRRKGIIASLEQSGVRVTCRQNLFGATLRDVISRAVIVLNIHRVEPSSLEMLRLLDLLPYAQFVVSERGFDPELERRFEKGIAFTQSDDIAEVCKTFLNDRDQCERIGRLGQAAFESVRQANVLRGLLSGNPE